MFFMHTWKKVIDGEKTVTRRIGDFPKYKEGKDYAVQKGWGGLSLGRIRIISARRSYLGYDRMLTVLHHGVVTIEEARREGFTSISNFIHVWKMMHHYMPEDTPIIRYKFELLKPTGEQNEKK